MISEFVDKIRSRIPGMNGSRGPVVPVVRLSGVISRGSRFRPGLSIETAAGPLKKAFSLKAAPAVAIVVDSPGGAPAQSHLIHKRIRALAAEHEKPVHVFVEDVCASGGYMIACAGDEIIADPASIVGSIGVLWAGFGFTEAIAKIGVERRVHTAGENKVILDPFRPEKESDVAHLKAIQEDVHTLFIDLVKERRGSLLADDPDLFSGLFWSGRRAVGLGLVDATGDILTVLKDKFGDDVRLKLIGGSRSLFSRRGLGLGGFGASLVDAAAAELDERLLRSRYGL